MKKWISVLTLLLMAAALSAADYALSLDGTNDYVTVNDIPADLVSGGAWTVETWFRFTEDGTVSGDYAIWAFNTSSGDNNFECGIRNDGIYIYTAAEGITSGGSDTYELNIWNHLAVTHTNSTDATIVYLNGKQVISTSHTDEVASDDRFSIGQEWDTDTPSGFFQGDLDEFRVWNDVRSQYEICTNMLQKMTGSESGLVANFSMADGSGSTLTDGTSRGNDGILINGDGDEWSTDYRGSLPEDDDADGKIDVSSDVDLLAVSKYAGYWHMNLEQTADISFNADETQVDWNGDGNADGSSPAGFMPIGINGTGGYVYFTGNYAGGDHTISNLYISRAGSAYTGLFGYVSEATVSGIILSSAEVTGGQNTGSLAGILISDCSVSKCSCDATVSGYNLSGGLIGSIESGSDVSECSSESSVSGQDYVGGLAGALYDSGSTLSNSYSKSTVSSWTSAGGLVGRAANSTLSNSYSVGTVSVSSSNEGGLVGTQSGAGVTDSFWNIDIESTDNSIGTGKTTAEMKNFTTYTAAGWDFVTETANGENDYWDADQTGLENDGYPLLAWQQGADTSLPVTLSSFSAEVVDGAIMLYWSTSSEIENAGFVIRRQALLRPSFAEAPEGGRYEGQAAGDWNQEEIASYLRDDALQGQGTTTEAHVYTYIDYAVQPGVTYTYSLSDVDFSGRETDHGDITLTVENNIIAAAAEFRLDAVYPNPFNASFTIPFSLKESQNADLILYSISGTKVMTVFSGNMPAGDHRIAVNTESLSSGVYLLRAVLNSSMLTQKIVLLK